MRLVGAGLIYQVINIDKTSLQVTDFEGDLDNFEDFIGKNLDVVLKDMLVKLNQSGGLTDKLHQLIYVRKLSDPGERMIMFEKIKEDVIYPLSERMHPAAQNIALFMGAVLAQEEQYNN